MKKTNGRFKLEASQGNRYNETALHEYDTQVKRKLRLVDELDEEAVTMLFEMFRSQIGELLLRLDEVDGELSFLH